MEPVVVKCPSHTFIVSFYSMTHDSFILTNVLFGESRLWKTRAQSRQKRRRDKFELELRKTFHLFLSKIVSWLNKTVFNLQYLTVFVKHLEPDLFRGMKMFF